MTQDSVSTTSLAAATVVADLDRALIAALDLTTLGLCTKQQSDLARANIRSVVDLQCTSLEELIDIPGIRYRGAAHIHNRLRAHGLCLVDGPEVDFGNPSLLDMRVPYEYRQVLYPAGIVDLVTLVQFSVEELAGFESLGLVGAKYLDQVARNFCQPLAQEARAAA